MVCFFIICVLKKNNNNDDNNHAGAMYIESEGTRVAAMVS